MDWKKVHDEYLSNEARAKQDWDGQTIKWTGTVYKIEDKKAQMANETHNGLPLNPIDVYLPTEELVKLNKGDEITVVGTLSLDTFTSIENASIV